MHVRNFSKTGDATDVPNLAGLQIGSYENFLQPQCLPDERTPEGLEGLFREFFPVRNLDDSLSIEYLGYELGSPALDETACRKLGLSYSMPLRVRLRVLGPESVEEDVYLADLPKMIGSGEFIVNGSERVIVAQIQRSPGVDFSECVSDSGQRLQSCSFIPERGTWIEFAVTRRETLQVRLGKSGYMPASWLLRATLCRDGGDAELLTLFHDHEDMDLSASVATMRCRLAGDVVNSDNGEVVASAGSILTNELAEVLRSSGMKTVTVLKNVDDPLLLNTVQVDPCKNRTEALLRIYRRFRPADPASPERAAEYFAERLANPANYCLGKVGRFRINRKFNLDAPPDRMTLSAEDILSAVKYIMALRLRKGTTDDIDDLGNRVLRPIGALLSDALRDAMMRWRRTIQSNLSPAADGSMPSPRRVAASRALAAAIETFFARSELSQVADQTNPLAALNHVRRISALGPGGLNRKRAGFEVRDVHPSHYGRICPIETPEGANIGLIAALGIFAKVDDYGFITTPYRKLAAAAGENALRYLRADDEKNVRLAPAGIENGGRSVMGRFGGDYVETSMGNIDYADVSLRQMVGVSAGLIPFLEHDDANRALMGSNMQRQAVPLLRTEKPIVATGLERSVARSSSMVVVAREDGVVTSVDASHIRIGERHYRLTNFRGLSEGACLNQKPIVREGQTVKAGDVIADGAATRDGELSLGRNILVAFMMWEGYNFEDAIIVSEDLVRSDRYTSIHIEAFTCELRETRVGREEFTRDIPNVSEAILANLDEKGIVRLGARVEPGDILVGKVAPKTKAELSPEDRLLREIFGKAGIDVSNESLTASPGTSGIVVDIAHFRRQAHLPDQERAWSRKEARRAAAEYDKLIADEFGAMIAKLAALPLADRTALPNLPRGATVHELLHLEENFRFSRNTFAASAKTQARDVYVAHHRRIQELKARRNYRIRVLRLGDQLPAGVLEMVKVSVAVKRPLAAGDKLAGRHGNKGVIARIVPREDMPFLPDGTPVEMILNPLGVPSRMNVGQILETHLAWAGRALGFQAVSPVFDGATEEDIRECLKEAGLPPSGKTVLHDGRTGKAFDQEVAVGSIYMMKLHHLVDDKVHARSTGPYSLITQQPLGGKARMGGQRLGEMEVWALEAYGAAHLLQEMLTVKSDDVEGRGRMYESTIKGPGLLEAGQPVSVDVLVHEVRGLCLNLRIGKEAEHDGFGGLSGPARSLVETAESAAERR